MERPSSEPLEKAVVVDTREAERPQSLQQDSSDRVSSPVQHGPQHEHSDSLVTIRLSELGLGEVQGANEANADTAPVEAPTIDSSALESAEDVQASESREELSLDTSHEVLAGRASLTEELPGLMASPLSPDSKHNSASTSDSISLDRKSGVTHSLSTQSTDATILASMANLGSELERMSVRSRSLSVDSSKSSQSTNVDWAELDKDEQKEQRCEGTDQSTVFLLARLEQENNELAKNPKTGTTITHERNRSGSRPPSLQQLKKLVSEPTKPSLRYSMLPSPPPMTELDLWSALVRNYPQTAQRLPTLTSNKIRGGIPAPLRGVVWMSIAGSRDPMLEEEYEKLSVASSPYEKLINKDIGRSFPGVDMFRDVDGEGQKMLGRVLNAFSLWDQEIGYCQGLGFVVGPLLMHMGDREAFCVLVRLMEHYDLRSCFLPTLSGLHLRIFQFQHLLTQHLPELTAHLEKLNVEPLYLSQWFLSFFGVTCPLPMLIRIYDVILTEGASETLMRVALSLMRRNEQKILAATEFEDVMSLLLSRGLWDTYGFNADDLVNDFVGWTGLVTREGLTALEAEFKAQQSPTVEAKPNVHTAATSFLGRFWIGSTSTTSPKSPTSTTLSTPVARPASALRRTPSKQSMASTLNSVESSETNQSAASTDATSVSRQASTSTDWVPQKPVTVINTNLSTRIAPNKDKDLHGQIEDLLTALSDLQREHSMLATELQREREEREEDRVVVGRVVERIKKRSALAAIPEDTEKPTAEPETPLSPTSERSVGELEDQFAPPNRRSSLVLQTKQQMREEMARWKEMYHEEVTRSLELSRQLTDREGEASSAREELREARGRIQDAFHEKQRLEKNNRELRSRKNTLTQSPGDRSPVATEQPAALSSTGGASGLREFKLGRVSTATTATLKLETPQQAAAAASASTASPQFSKRISSLSAHNVLATDDHRPPEQDALLLELVNAKTAEVMARQELEEVKGKLDTLRKLLLGGNGSGGGGNTKTASQQVTASAAAGILSGTKRNSPPSPVSSAASSIKDNKDKAIAASPVAATPSSASVGGGFFSGWGKRAVSGAV